MSRKKLLTFKMQAAKMPSNGKNWFDAFIQGRVCAFKSLTEANNMMIDLCIGNGTIKDENYDLYGPYCVPCKENGDSYVWQTQRERK